MLALKTNKVSPILRAAAARHVSGCSKHSQTVCSANATVNRNSPNYVKSTNCDLINYSAVSPFALTTLRFCASRPPPSPPPEPSSSSQSQRLPDKQQLEKYFFKAIALVWDVSVWSYSWSKRNFNNYVIKNPTVQTYWKQFIEKVENSRKN